MLTKSNLDKFNDHWTSSEIPQKLDRKKVARRLLRTRAGARRLFPQYEKALRRWKWVVGGG